jgi:hypothetical protein
MIADVPLQVIDTCRVIGSAVRAAHCGQHIIAERLFATPNVSDLLKCWQR